MTLAADTSSGDLGVAGVASQPSHGGKAAPATVKDGTATAEERQRKLELDFKNALTRGDTQAALDIARRARALGIELGGVKAEKMTVPYWLLGDYSTAQRKQMAKTGEAQADGSYPIKTRKDLSNALKDFNRTGQKPSDKAHIVKRARALGLTSMLPDDWNIKAESPVMAPVLLLEGELPKPQILAEGTPENGGIMRIRVPFYVSNSKARIGGFDKPVYFEGKLLPAITAEAKAQIAAKKQPLTVYPRHAVAMAGDHLPIGGVVDISAEGRIGYADIDIDPTSDGKDAQVLVKNGRLNAVSLRSKRFEMEERKVNGEDMYVPTRLSLDGIDFAPEGPAMPTYGIEVLQAEATVEPIDPDKSKTRRNKRVEITAETLRAEAAEVVAEIEAPLKKQVAELQKENGELKAEKWEHDKAAYLAVVAAKFPAESQEETKKILAEACKDVKSLGEVKAICADQLMAAMEIVKNTAAPAETIAERLAKQFPGVRAGGNGKTSGVQAEKKEGDGKDDKVVSAEVVAELEGVIPSFL